MAETFNSYIIRAREKLVIDMLEDIKRAIMVRMAKKREEIDKWHGRLSPRIQEKIERHKVESRWCEAIYNEDRKYEVTYMR